VSIAGSASVVSSTTSQTSSAPALPAQTSVQPAPAATPAREPQREADTSVGRDAASQASRAILAATVAGGTNAASQAAENAVRLARGNASAPQDGVRANGAADPSNDGEDLQQITGIGPVVAAQLKALGVRGVTDIAMWSHEDIARVASTLAINGRIDREDWVGQARVLIANQAIEMDGDA